MGCVSLENTRRSTGWLGSCHHPFGYGHLEAQCLQVPGEPGLDLVPSPVVEVVGAEVDVDSAVGQEVIGGHQDRVGHRNDGPLVATPCRQVSIPSKMRHRRPFISGGGGLAAMDHSG